MIAESYRLVRLLGEGGMGAVYEAEHLRVPRRFAVKILKPEIAHNRDMFERFRREAEIASASGHEHIVEVTDFNVLPDGAPYMILEYLEGETIAQRISRKGRFTLDETLRIIEMATSALEAVHARGIVHRDLKPQNLFLTKRGKRDDFLKVLDFGISKVLHDSSLATQEGQMLGTPNYMAPEQLASNTDAIDPRTDVFALGAIAWECLAGRMAFRGSVPSVVYQICHGEPENLELYASGLPSEVVAVIARAMAKKREDRYATVRELGDAFMIACGKTPSVRPPAEHVVVQSGNTGDASAATVASGQRTLPSGDAATLAASTSDLRAPVKRAPIVPIVAVALLGIVGAAFFFVWNKKAPVTASAPSAPTTTSAAPAPSTTSSIEVRFRAQPKEAEAFLDGVAVTSPITLPLNKATHVLELRAAGFTTESRTVIADRDRELDIVLTKAPIAIKPGKPAVTVAPPSTPAAPTTKPTIEIKGPMEKAL